MVALIAPPMVVDKRASTHRQRKLARKSRGGAIPRPHLPAIRSAYLPSSISSRPEQHVVAGKTILYESETLLTRKERRHIDQIIFDLVIADRPVPLHLLDYRWWEIRRKTGWQPGWPDARGGTVYSWWISLHPDDRAELASLSRCAGMKTAKPF